MPGVVNLIDDDDDAPDEIPPFWKDQFLENFKLWVQTSKVLKDTSQKAESHKFGSAYKL